eukprot:g5135.t1
MSELDPPGYNEDEDSDFEPDAKEMMEADKILGKSKKDESKGPSKKVKAKVDKIWESMNVGHSKMPKFKSLASLQRKGKKRKVSNWKHMLSSKKKTKKQISSIALEAAKKATLGSTTTSVVKFAGKEMTMTTKNASSKKTETSKNKISRGLDSMLDCIKDPKQINTVEKSSYDWDKYKAENKLDEEFDKQAQNGYVNKKEFLNRVDWRRFESEKKIRDRERAKRMQSEKK